MRKAAARSIFALLASILAACGGGGNQAQNASETAAPAATQSAAPAATQAGAETSPQASAQATAVTVPTPTPNPNLLDVSNGTILRSYSPPQLDHMNDGTLGNAAEGIGAELPGGAGPPYVFTFELPGMTKIESFAVDLRAAPDASAPPPNVAVAVSSTGPAEGFKDLGTMTGDANGLKKTLAAGVTVRWVRVTANQLFNSISATGTLATPPPSLKPAGTYIEDDVPDLNGSFVTSGRVASDWRSRFASAGSGLTATWCNGDSMTHTFVGQLTGRNWNATFTGNKDANPDTVRAVINDDASIVAGVDGNGGSTVYMRTTDTPAFCTARVTGTGARHVLVLDQDPIPTVYPLDGSPPLDGYRFSAIGAGMLDSDSLQGVETVFTRGVCKLTDLMGPQQLALLLAWSAAPGHKTILSNANCQSGSTYTWLPYPLTNAGPGPESDNASLIQVENSALGTNDKNDAVHYVDTLDFVKRQNAMANSFPATTADPHWCGHFFTAKTTNLNGFVQTYATDGGGILIYDGFNDSDNGNPQLQKIRQLELALPVPSDLPCTQLASDPFVLAPSQEAAFSAGAAQTIRAPMQLLANLGYNGHVTVKATGAFPASVSPAEFDLAGGTKDVAVTVNVPASAKAGVYTVNVVADNGSGKTAQASITLTGTATIPKKAAMAVHQRIRIYGIHFDYDSAQIQPRSEPVIADIAALLKANPSWHFEVSGHTDSDGGAAYNLGLSQRRAQAVVDDLVKRYGIARSRLVAKGYGLARPVASNANDAGKAQNRRVELERLQ